MYQVLCYLLVPEVTHFLDLNLIHDFILGTRSIYFGPWEAVPAHCPLYPSTLLN